jgi:hypothetical protein
MLSEESRQVALPAVALAEAFRQAGGDAEAMLRILADHDQTLAVPLDAPDAEPVGILGKATTTGVAHAVLVVRRTRAYLLTTSAKSVEDLVDPELIIEV